MFTQRHSKILFCESTDNSQIGTALLDLSEKGLVLGARLGSGQRHHHRRQGVTTGNQSELRPTEPTPHSWSARHSFHMEGLYQGLPETRPQTFYGLP